MDNAQLPFITNDENPAAYWMLDILWVSIMGIGEFNSDYVLR